MPRRSDWPDSLTPTAFQILLALADEDRHGLGIVDEIDVRTGGEIKLGPGSLYGTIKRLREVGFIIETRDVPNPSNDDPRRRYYAITPVGREALAREARRMEVMIHMVRSKAILHSGEGR
jgi:DNA-binding PadR family transcriptional regulator